MLWPKRPRGPRDDGAYLVGYHDRLDRRYMPRRCLPGSRDDYRRGWDDAHRAVRSLQAQMEAVVKENSVDKLH